MVAKADRHPTPHGLLEVFPSGRFKRELLRALKKM
jgi:hypothetical protein